MIFTSEQVSLGHPDKICDQISDAILTECLKQDKKSRVAAETLIKDYNIILAGEITTNANLNYTEIVNSVLKKIGLENLQNYNIINFLGKQSNEIANGVDIGGAGDQGMMFGYATNETKEYLPLPYVLATKVLIKLNKYRQIDSRLKADAKSQVSFDYDSHRIDTFLLSTQHSESISLDEIKEIVSNIMKEVAREYNLNEDFNVLVNPTGSFIIGSSFGDSGLTGRKIIADTYGGMARHGGGAFSGKDPTKVDRSGAYIARKIAKDIVKKGFADKCEIQISYAIGIARPTSVYVNCFGTESISIDDIEDFVIQNYDLTPKGIISFLDLTNVDYNLTSTYGHFGKDYLPWEK